MPDQRHIERHQAWVMASIDVTDELPEPTASWLRSKLNSITPAGHGAAFHTAHASQALPWLYTARRRLPG
jgi:hypothetical protein